MPAAPKKLPQRLTRDEARALLDAPSRRYPTGIRNRAILRLMYRAGLRAEEAVSLTPRDVQLSRNEVRVNLGKGGRDRVVWIDDATVEVLDRWRERRPRSDWFFCTLAGGSVSTSYLRAMVARMGRRARVEIRCHPHLLRHTYLTELLEDGYRIHEVQKLAGHARLDTTALYLHVTDDDLKDRLRARPG